MILKFKLFFKRHYKKLVVPFICVFLSFSLVLVASAETFNYNLWQYYDSSQYLVYYESGSGIINTRISNHNPNVPDSILGTSVPDIQAENGLTSFYLVVRLPSDKGPLINSGSSLSLNGDLISNFSFCGSDGLPCTLSLAAVYLSLGDGQGLPASTYGTNKVISGTNIDTYSYYANFDTSSFTGRVSYFRFLFHLDRPAYQTEWASHELQFSCSLASGVYLQVVYDPATVPKYPEVDDSTINDALDIEGNLLDSVGGDLGELSQKFDDFSGSVIGNRLIYKGLMGVGYFLNSFIRDDLYGSNFFGVIVNFCVVVGLAGFVLNLVVSVVSRFSGKGKGD